MKLRLALAAATCLVLPLAAHAQPVTGPYVSLGAGTSFLTNVRVHDSLTNGGGKAIFNPSYAGIAAAGYGLGGLGGWMGGFRVEVAGDYFHNTSNKVGTGAPLSTGHGQYNMHGSYNTYGPMFNILYDFDFGIPVYPYLGGGVGYQYVQTKLNIGSPGGTIASSGVEGSLAYQAIVGLAFPLPVLPQLSFTIEYHWMQLADQLKYGDSIRGGFPAGNPNGGTLTTGKQSSNTVIGGVRYQIFPPPAAPVPMAAPAAAPAPAAAKTYLVFFDWDKYNLTPRATQIIAQAASDSHTQQVTTINVSGYTDTSGTPQYNQGLSQRRAKAVAAQLVTDGVPASEISTHAFGETHLLVPTGPGVREPQNRRVEIVLN